MGLFLKKIVLIRWCPSDTNGLVNGIKLCLKATKKKYQPFNYELTPAASTSDRCILSPKPKGAAEGRNCLQHTCKIPPCRIHFPIIESVVWFILVHLSNGGYQLLFPFQSSKPGSQGDDVIPGFPESHGAHRSI